MKTAAFHPLQATVFGTALFVAGCATTGTQSSVRGGGGDSDIQPRDMVAMGSDGTAIPWEALVARAAAADVVILGELHDDFPGHRFQTALVEALLEQQRFAVCLEMLERDEQAFVDAFLADEISQETFVDITDSMDWGAKGRWNDFYQPTIDAAKAAGAPVVAANAPRRFTRLARLEGFERLAAFAEAYPGHFVVPEPIDEGDYAERFKNTMRHHSAAPAPKKGKKGAESGGMPPMTEEKLATFFRAQQVWDATMADSVVKAQRDHGKAVLLIGQFHTDHRGGTLLRMKAAAPELQYLTISVQKASERSEEDRDRADIVVYRPAAR